MPKKKRFRGKKEVRKEEIVIAPESKMENNEENHSKVTISDEKSVSVGEGRTNNAVFLDGSEVKQKSGIPKKKFSFNSKEKKHVKKDNKSVDIKRSNSLSLDDSQNRSKIPLPKYRTLPHKGKSMSASCSNFETQSMVLNPGMDDWRMTGLLKNVEQSNSMCSLASPNLTNESQLPKATTPSAKIKQNCLDEENEPEVCLDNSQNVDIIFEENENNDIEIELEKEKVLCNFKENEKNSKYDVNLKSNKQDTKDMENNVEREVFKDERYELDDDNVVTIQSLADLIRQKSIEMPADIDILNDWLVLDLISTNITIS